VRVGLLYKIKVATATSISRVRFGRGKRYRFLRRKWG